MEQENSWGLKLCPFCGGKANLTHIFYDNTRHLVQCTKCGCRTDVFTKPQEATMAWNIRQGGGANG